MDVIEAIRTRRSIRRYRDTPVSKDVLEKILDAGRWAPSSHNSQPWYFLVIEDQALKETLAQLLPYGKFLPQAPLAIAVVVDPHETGLPMVDGALGAYSMLLAAHGLGLGGCWINPIRNEEEAKRVLGIPLEMRLVAILSLGYPAEEPVKSRKELSTMVFKDKFGNSA